MFKFSIPSTLVLFTGSLSLLAIGSLLVMSNSVHTSDIQPAITTESSEPIASAFLNDQTPIAAGEEKSPSKPIKGNEGRKRNARFYSGSSSGSYTNHQSSPLDSYAAAYAAANSPSAADQQSAVTNDAALAFSSFGEPSPSANSGGPSHVAGVASGSGTATARQLVAAAAAAAQDHASGPHSANYYANYMSPSSNDVSYSNQAQSSHYPSSSLYHHYQQPPGQSYYKPTSYERHSPLSGNYYDRSYASSIPSQLWGSPNGFGPNSLMSSASTALSHWTSGFTISEIICTVVAVAIGAIILGAPFFLIYLALMGNFSGSGTLSLTNPSQGSATPGGAPTPANGRRKRLAVFEQITSKDDHRHASEFAALADAVVSQLSPFVDVQQVTSTLKTLVASIEKYSNKRGRESLRTNM